MAAATATGSAIKRVMISTRRFRLTSADSVSASAPVDFLWRPRPLDQFLTLKCYAHLRTRRSRGTGPITTIAAELRHSVSKVGHARPQEAAFWKNFCGEVTDPDTTGGAPVGTSHSKAAGGSGAQWIQRS